LLKLLGQARIRDIPGLKAMIKRQEQVVGLLEAMVKNNAKVSYTKKIFRTAGQNFVQKQDVSGQRFIALTSDADLVLEPLSHSLLVDSPAYTLVRCFSIERDKSSITRFQLAKENDALRETLLLGQKSDHSSDTNSPDALKARIAAETARLCDAKKILRVTCL
jgi:hypothetical protein